MKNIAFVVLIAAVIFAASCKKETESEKFRLLTAHTWTTDSLLSEGVDAGGPGQMLEKFKGDAKFNKDGSGYFGKFTGTWRFSYNETNLVIDSDSLQAPVSATIKVLNETDFKITTVFPNLLNPSNPYDIRITFKAK